MGAECEKCGTDLAETQWDEGGLRCVPCDLRSERDAALALLREAGEALNDGLSLQCGSSDDAHNTYLESGRHTEDCPGCVMENVLLRIHDAVRAE